MLWEEIESVEDVADTEDVFDITVNSTHNFFADGICVHNCVAGVPSWSTYAQFPDKSFDELTPELLNEEGKLDAVLGAIGNEVDRLADAVGVENVFLELQFNKLSAQHLTNRALISFAHLEGMKLIATADSHYCSPDLWRAREVYKLLGRMGRGSGKELDPDSIPSDIKQLKCELYPKNADQMWSSYEECRIGHSFYNDNLVKEAIENTWHIAHDVIGDVSLDTSVKLPSFGVRPGLTPFQTLLELCKEGMRDKHLSGKSAYISRLKTELGVIQKLDNAMYFLTLRALVNCAKKECLLGPGRGCFVPDTRVMMSTGEFQSIDSINIGDIVTDAHGDARQVINVLEYDIEEELVELTFEDGRIIKCTKDHKFLTNNRGYVSADELTDEDDVVDLKSC